MNNRNRLTGCRRNVATKREEVFPPRNQVPAWSRACLRGSASRAIGCPLARGRQRLYSASMGIEQLKAELRAASPETQEELFTLLGVLRRAGDPARQRRLAEKLDSPAGWVSEEDAARRLGLSNENR